MSLDEQRRQELEIHRLEPRHMEVALFFQQGFLHWQFGPYTAGTYAIFFNAVPVLRPVAPSGRIALSDRPVTAQLLYQSPEGWSALSPELTLDPSVSPSFEWSGAGLTSGESVPERGTR
jgi:hypothetical protein